MLRTVKQPTKPIAPDSGDPFRPIKFWPVFSNPVAGAARRERVRFDFDHQHAINVTRIHLIVNTKVIHNDTCTYYLGGRAPLRLRLSLILNVGRTLFICYLFTSYLFICYLLL